MNSKILACLKKQPVELEYCPPSRPSPIVLTPSVNEKYFVWDVFEDREVVVLLVVTRTTHRVAPPPGTTAPNRRGQPAEPNVLKLTNFTLRFLNPQWITSINANVGFHVNEADRKPVAEARARFYEAGEEMYQYTWDVGVWKRVEDALVRYGLRSEAVEAPSAWKQQAEQEKRAPSPAPAPVAVAPVMAAAPVTSEGYVSAVVDGEDAPPMPPLNPLD